MFVKERFKLNPYICDQLKDLEPPFGYNGFGKLIFYRTYSRIKKDGSQEDWADVVVRCTEGTFSIRKDWYIKNHIDWDENFWQEYASRFAIAMFHMRWMPPGRGLWAMGTDFIYERGSMALNNCGAVKLKTETLAEDLQWMMDALMHGVGVGFEAIRDDNMRLYKPHGTFDFEIPDSREGWTESERLIVNAFTRPNQKLPRLIYDKVRPAGTPIKGFGGVACGPEPLRRLHEQTIQQFELFGQRPEYDSVYLKTNLACIEGCCVVAGNLRRSAELSKGKFNDPIFMDLKNYRMFPERESFGWMTNNSVALETEADFDMLGEIAKRVINNGEPGYINLINFKKGRIGKNDDIKEDKADLINPCGESQLEDKELCVEGNTRIQMRDSCKKIKDLVGKEVEIWNGTSWSKVIPFKFPEFSKLYRVTFSDGSYLDCTGNHTFYIRKNKSIITRGLKAEPCCNLEYGDVLESFELGKIEGINEKHAYEYGFYMGDGCWDHYNNKPVIDVFDDQTDCYALAGTHGPITVRKNYNVLSQRIYLQHILTKEKCLSLKESNLPDWVFELDKESIKAFVEGYLDADGTVSKQTNTDNYVIYGPEKKLLDIQILLKRIGVNHTNVYFGHYGMTNKGMRKEPLYHLYIPSYECDKLEGKFKKCKRIGLGEFLNPKTQEMSSRKLKQRVIKVEFLKEDSTYCFTEKEKHKGVFNNVLTGQCNVDDTLPTMCKDEIEWYDSCEYATTYASTVSLLPTYSKETNKVIARNRRILVSIIDFSGWKLEHGVHRVTKYLRKGYKRVRKTNHWANDEAGVPRSIRTTGIKPGGTVPKLPGKTPGIGHPTFDYTIRRVRLSRNIPVSQIFINANIPYEPDIFDPNTLVFEYPILQGPARPAAEVSLWEQAMNLILVQREWADNAVSNTLYFKPRWVLTEVVNGYEDFRDVLDHYLGIIEGRTALSNYPNECIIPNHYRIIFKDEEMKIFEYNHNHEEDDIEPVLSAIAPLTKSVSLLPHSAKGAYKQMPEEGISEEEYRRRLAEIKPIDWTKFSGSDGMDEKYCSGPTCES